MRGYVMVCLLVLLAILSTCESAISDSVSSRMPVQLTESMQEDLIQITRPESGRGCDWLGYSCNAYFGWFIPDAWGDSLMAMRFSPELCCTLSYVEVCFDGYLFVGTPGVSIQIWSDSAGLPQSIIDSIDVPYAYLTFYPGVTTVDFGGSDYIFCEDFHVVVKPTYTTPSDVIALVSDDGSCGTLRSTEYCQGAWETMSEGWGHDVNFLIHVELCCASGNCDPPDVITVPPSDTLCGTWCEPVSFQFEAIEGDSASPGSLSWSLLSGPGEVSEGGLYSIGTAPMGDYSVTVKATNDCMEGTSSQSYTFILSALPADSICTPSQNSVDVPLDEVIKGHFGTALDPATVNDSTVVAYSEQHGLIQGLVSYDAGSESAVFQPGSPFANGDIITSILTDGIHCDAGLNYGGFSWSFAVETERGTGLLRERNDYAVGERPMFILAADFDNDGDIDLAVGNERSYDIYLFTNDSGEFLLNEIFADPDSVDGTYQGPIAATDVDGDSDMDLIAFVDGNDEWIAVLRNDGMGGFGTTEYYEACVCDYGFSTADMNNDGGIDILILCNELKVMYNNGDGTFGAPQNLFALNEPVSVACGDFDNDGWVDVTACDGGSEIAVAWNSANGILVNPDYYSVDNQVTSIEAADLDNDGYLDIVCGHDSGDYLSLLWNNGDGTFADYVTLLAGDRPASVLCGDVNSDGLPDILCGIEHDHLLSLLINTGSRMFASPSSFDVVRKPFALAMADFDIDGDLDFVSAGYEADSITVLFNCSVPQVLNADDQVTVQNQTRLAFYPDIYDPEDTAHTITYLEYPHWCSVQNDTVIGIAPDTLFTETLTVVVEDNCVGDTTSFTVTIYVCGDVNSSSALDIDDVVYLIAYIFSGGSAPDPLVAGDVNCSGSVDIDDVVYLISYIFSGGNPPGDTDGDGIPDC